MHTTTADPFTLDFTPLRTLRARSHVSRRELATKIGVNYTTLWRWEKGMVDPSLSLIVRTSRALGVSMWDLFRVVEK